MTMRPRTTLSPDMISQRPRKILMPNVFNSEFIFADRHSRQIITDIRKNINTLCDIERNINLRFIKWPSKFIAEIKDICRLELV